MKVFCFGMAKDITGLSTLDLDNESVSTVEELKNYLIAAYPEFEKYKSFMIAVNQSYANNDLVLNGTEEIAIIPPVSGG